MEDVIVIKIGGIASQDLSESFIEQVKAWQTLGKKIVIVHGGGFAITKLMDEAKIPVEKVNGLRVTSQEAMKLVSYALFEIVGQSMTEKLLNAGLDSLQLRSHLPDILEADFLDRSLYGYVGQIKQVHVAALERLFQDNFIPIIASVGYTSDGQLLNVNADYVATALAIALGAEKLILMTDVKGVMENGEVIEQLLVSQVADKIKNQVITGGMIPKIKSAAETVLAGVNQILIGDNLLTGTVIGKG